MTIKFDLAAMMKFAEEDFFIAYAITNMLAKQDNNLSKNIVNVYEVVFNSYILDGEDDMKMAYQKVYNEIYH